MGVHFREVGVHWVLYPHATSHPAAPALRMSAAAPKHNPGRPDTPQQRQQWHTRNNAAAYRHKSHPMGMRHHITPLGHTPQQSESAARITRLHTPSEVPLIFESHRHPTKCAALIARPPPRAPSQPQIAHSATTLPNNPQRLQNLPASTTRIGRRISHLLPMLRGMTHFCRGQRGQIRKPHLTHCHH